MDLTAFFEEPQGTAIERYFRENIGKNQNMMVPYYLMAAYAYYVQDDPIVGDAFFDHLAKDMLKVYDSIVHRHKHHITKDMLVSGTYLGEYPSIVEGAVDDVREKFK